jgi:hypothetical protein
MRLQGIWRGLDVRGVVANRNGELVAGRTSTSTGEGAAERDGTACLLLHLLLLLLLPPDSPLLLTLELIVQ